VQNVILKKESGNTS